MATGRDPRGVNPSPSEPFCGAILTGGRSSRLGRDKATLDPFGLGSMVDVGIDALLGAGCEGVATVGGDRAPANSPDVVHLADLHPGEGPLGGIITALRWAPQDLVVIFACDMPFVDSDVVTALLESALQHPRAAVTLVRVDGRAQPLTALWRRDLALACTEEHFRAGRRAPRLLLPFLEHGFVDTVVAGSVVDIDSAEDLDRYARHAEQRRLRE